MTDIDGFVMRIGVLERELAEARAQIATLEQHVEELRDKVDGDDDCACSFDAPGEVCMGHSPLLKAARAQIAAIEATDRRLIEENGRLQAQIAAKDAVLREARMWLINWPNYVAKIDAALAAPARETT
jgi:cell division protein FtsB